MSKWAKLRISKEYFEAILRADVDMTGITTNAPKDLKIIGFSNDNIFYPGTFVAWVESDSFPERDEEDEPPAIIFTYTKVFP